MNYQTPGVYVEEISTLPPSVAEVSTAVPAFLGYTEKGPKIARVDTLLEFQQLFGGPRLRGFEVAASTPAKDGSRTVRSIAAATTEPDYLLYYGVDHYFKNGGGSCWVVSVGNYPAPLAGSDFESGLGLVRQEDEPTLILLTDAVALPIGDYVALCQQVLQQCADLGDRFGVFDVPSGNVAEFRMLASESLKYGAAYHPYLRTVLAYAYGEDEVKVTLPAAGATPRTPSWKSGEGGIVVTYTGEVTEPAVKVVKAGDFLTFEVDGAGRMQISGVASETGTQTGATVAAAWATWVAAEGNDPAGYSVEADGAGDQPVGHTDTAVVPLGAEPEPVAGDVTLASLKDRETALYNQIKTALAAQRVTLPPSSAMAGIYARVDRQRGVWKAPANVAVSAVLGPVTKITDLEQDKLNVDATGGKSINAIRAFTGKGTLVWGARTLAGNDNEWRYVPVRRLFNLIEESCRKSTSFAVFEPNDMTTWLKVQGMVESYLYSLWERGALAGPTAESAYFVNVGLGKTMSTQDVLEGRMIVEIGVAAVRPAEFIILRFSHKLQEA